MIFTRIQLKNYGLFTDAEFDLEPNRNGDGSLQNIVLFGGKNGSGKTTILEAVRLCLYGQRARGSRVRRRDYEQFLRARIHRSRDVTFQPSKTSVALEFSHVHSGKSTQYRVERSWRDNGTGIQERLRVSSPEDDQVEYDQEHWEHFIRELIPPGVSQLFFFDGEKIRSLAEQDGEDSELAHSIKALLGLDLTDRLQADLSLYLRRMEDKRAGASDSGCLVDIEVQVADVNERLMQRRQARAQIHTKAGMTRRAIQRLEGRIGREGGSFARHREDLLMKRGLAEEEMLRIKATIRELCDGLLPFSIVPTQCETLEEVIRRDQAIRAAEAVRAHIEERLPDVAADLSAWLQDGAPKPGTEAEVMGRLRKSLVPGETGEEPVHPLSDESARRILDAIRVVRDEMPNLAGELASDLERTTRELGRVQTALEKAPDDDVLRPLLEELATLHADLAEAKHELASVEEEVSALENEAKGLQREHAREEERLASAGGVEDRVQLVARVQRSVAAFAAELRKRRIEELRETFQRCFSVLARKEDLLHDVRIDPDTFEVTFFDEQGRSLPKEDLSAGERQMYAIAILWALALTARRPLPFLIDTPLARLDSEHRATLVQEYFPHVAHQVVIFSTDTEIDQEYFNQLRPHVARMYHLSYDEETNATHVEDGYFWSGEREGDEREVESPAA